MAEAHEESLIVSLGNEPRLNFHAWRLSIRDLASTMGTAHFDHGWLGQGILISDLEWAASHPGEDTRPLPTRPHDLAGNASNAAVAVYRQHCERSQQFINDRIKLTKVMLASIGDRISDRLRDPLEGLSKVTPDMIMTYVTTHYGVMTAEDVMELRRKASSKTVHSHSEFNVAVSDMSQIFRTLSSIGQDISAAQQLEILQQVLNTYPAGMRTLQEYYVRNIALAARSFNGAVEYLDLNLAIWEATLPAAASVYTQHTAANAQVLTSVPVQPPSNKQRNKTYYCFVHGYWSNHNGKECRTMLRKPQTYTMDMLQATSHEAIPNHPGAIQKARFLN